MNGEGRLCSAPGLNDVLHYYIKTKYRTCLLDTPAQKQIKSFTNIDYKISCLIAYSHRTISLEFRLGLLISTFQYILTA